MHRRGARTQAKMHMGASSERDQAIAAREGRSTRAHTPHARARECHARLTHVQINEERDDGLHREEAPAAVHWSATGDLCEPSSG